MKNNKIITLLFTIIAILSGCKGEENYILCKKELFKEYPNRSAHEIELICRVSEPNRA